MSYVFIFKTNMETFQSHLLPRHSLCCVLDSRPLILPDFSKLLRQKREMMIKNYLCANAGENEDIMSKLIQRWREFSLCCS